MADASSAAVPDVAAAAANTVDASSRTQPGKRLGEMDREKNCPFLLRVFLRNDQFHEDQFALDQLPVEDEVQIYVWRDTTLRELFYQMLNTSEDCKREDARLNFRVVYLEQSRQRYNTRDLGSVHGLRRGPDDQRTLHQCRVNPGEFLDVCLSFGQPLAVPTPARRGGRGNAINGSGEGRTARRGDRYEPLSGRRGQYRAAPVRAGPEYHSRSAHRADDGRW